MRKSCTSHALMRLALLLALLALCDKVETKRHAHSELERKIRAGAARADHLASVPRSGVDCSRSDDTPCVREGCQCWNDDTCRNNQVFLDIVKKCRECVEDSDCSHSSCGPYWAQNEEGEREEGRWCSDCGGAAMATAALKCMRPCNRSQAGAEQCKEVECNEGLLASGIGHDVTYTSGACACTCCNGQTPECVEDFNPSAALIMPVVTVRCECIGTVTASAATNVDAITDGANSTVSFVSDCVETAWLKRNGFAHGILKERAASKVLCLPGMPCATEGHLLAECDQHGTCELVTYSQVCRENEFGCAVDFLPVSRLSHSVDWSTVRIPHRKAGMSLHLTSVSQHVSGALYYTSRTIAVVASYLGSRGYGRVCDAVLLAVLWLEGVFRESVEHTMFVRHFTA